jgi:hypothetical protein
VGDAVSDGVEDAEFEPVLDADAPSVRDAVGVPDVVGVPVEVGVGDWLGVRLDEGGIGCVTQTASAEALHGTDTYVLAPAQDEQAAHGDRPVALHVDPETQATGVLATHDAPTREYPEMQPQTEFAVAVQAKVTIWLTPEQAAHAAHGVTPVTLQVEPATHAIAVQAPPDSENPAAQPQTASDEAEHGVCTIWLAPEQLLQALQGATPVAFQVPAAHGELLEMQEPPLIVNPAEQPHTASAVAEQAVCTTMLAPEQLLQAAHELDWVPAAEYEFAAQAATTASAVAVQALVTRCPGPAVEQAAHGAVPPFDHVEPAEHGDPAATQALPLMA